MRANPNIFRAGLRRIQEEIHENALPSGRVALQAKLSVDLGREIQLRSVGALQIILAKLRRIFDNWSEFDGRAIRFENAVRDAMPAARAALQRVGQLLPLGIVFQQLRAFRDGLKHVVQIVNQTFQR